MNPEALKLSNGTELKWSPLPMRKPKFDFKEKQKSFELKSNSTNLYPNFDMSVWLRSCDKEIIQPIPGKTSGAIPKWLNGALLRNGPGSLKAGNDYFDHLFDSSALLHRFSIANGLVTYQCRFVQSEVYKRNWKANRIVLTEFGTQAVPDPCHSIFDRVAAIFNPNSDQISDNSMITVCPFGDQIYAFGEMPIIHQIDSKTLSTEKRVNVSDYVSIVHHTAHPHVTCDGNYNLGLSIQKSGPHHAIVHFPFNENGDRMFEQAKIVAKIPVRWPLHPPYMHSFGMTDNYFIVVEQPLSISLGGMVLTKITNKPLLGAFRWYQNETTVFNVISRKTGCLAYKFHAEAFCYMHIINQYEIDDYIVIDICIYQDPSMLECMYVETMKTMQQNENYARMFRSKPVRFVLPLGPSPEKGATTNLIELKGTKAEAYYSNGGIFVRPEKLSNLGCEMPRIHYEQYLGKPYRYFYAISADVDAENPGTIIKIDTKTKVAKTWCEKNCYPSEPIFVPRPDGIDEDDGVVLSAIVWGGDDDTNHVGLIVLDAMTFSEIGRSEFTTPGQVPKCLHGWFIFN